MESSLISTSCPKCGGKLGVDPSKDLLICEYCGAEHIIRRSVDGNVSLEAFARCPLCKRNDQVEKVTGIMHKQMSQSDGYVPQQEIYSDSDGHIHSNIVNVPVQTRHATDLARRLAPPAQPDPPRPDSKGGLLALAIIVTVLAVCCLSAMIGPFVGLVTSYGLSSGGKTIILVIALLGVTLGILLPTVLFSIWSSSKKKDEGRVNQEMIPYTQAYYRWVDARARYEKLYYCGRDDIVFIPGEKTSANVADVIRYIYTNP